MLLPKSPHHPAPRRERVALIAHFRRFAAAVAFLAVLVSFSENYAMPQTLDDLKQQQQLDEARTAALKAQTARIDAEKALDKAQKPDAPAKADFDVPDSGYKGDVKTNSKAGQIESSLLAARALTIGSQGIAKKLKPVLDTAIANKPAGTPVLLYGYAEIPALQAFVAYKTQYAIVQKTLESALAGLRAAHPATTARFVSPEMVGLALDSVNKLLGFFRTDYSVEGVDVKFDDNVPLMAALGGELAGDKYKYDVRMPAAYTPPADLTTDPIFKEITALADQDVKLRQAVAAGANQLAGLTAEAAKPNISAEDKAQLAQSMTSLKDALEFAKAAQALYDTFAAKLAGGDDKNQFPLDTIMRQNTVRILLQKGSPLLAVRIEKAGGSYYTKKNLWSFFGGMPFYNMGGVVLTYALFDGPTGRLLAAGTVPIDGGFVRVTRLPEALAK